MGNMATFKRVTYLCLLLVYFETVFGTSPSPNAMEISMTNPISLTEGGALVQSIPVTVSPPSQGNDPPSTVVTSDRNQIELTAPIMDTKTVTKTVIITSFVATAQTTSMTPMGIPSSQCIITVTQTIRMTLIRTSTIKVSETITLDRTLSTIQTAVVTDTLTTIATEISVSPTSST